MMGDEIQTSREVIAEEKDIPLEEVPEDVGAADVLAATTGDPREKFTPDYDEYPLPDPEDLTFTPVEDDD